MLHHSLSPNMQRKENHLAQWPNYELEKLIVKEIMYLSGD
jgi:hypothetical protein